MFDCCDPFLYFQVYGSSFGVKRGQPKPKHINFHIQPNAAVKPSRNKSPTHKEPRKQQPMW